MLLYHSIQNKLNYEKKNGIFFYLKSTKKFKFWSSDGVWNDFWTYGPIYRTVIYIFDLFDNIFSFYPTVPYIRLHNRLIFKNHSLICRFLCIQNVLSNSIQHFECVFFSSIYLYSKKWIDNLEWCRFLFWFIHEKKTKCMYNKKGKPLIDIENLQQTEFETHLMIIGYSRE